MYSLDLTEESLSDDDVFFGKLTLKEVKKRIFWNSQHKQHASSAVNSPRRPEDHNSSLKILQTHSEPNLLPSKDNNNHNLGLINTASPGWHMGDDDSFIKLESMVEKLCVSPTPGNIKKTEEFNNTLDVIEYILNNPPTSDNKREFISENELQDLKPVVKDEHEVLTDICLKKLQNISPQKNIKAENNISEKLPDPPQNTPVKTEKKCTKDTDFMTPIHTKPKPIFKTPAQPVSAKKSSAVSVKKTPSKSNAYQHITSPVASYIKNCPIVPLVKDVHPKKPLPGPSSIPKFINSNTVKQVSNKENINLPTIAYKSAKKTKLIDMPEEQKLPQSQWAKKIMTSLPRPMVIKHSHRENSYAKRKLLSHSQHEDSFANLSYNQAELSVCTQKPAFKNV